MKIRSALASTLFKLVICAAATFGVLLACGVFGHHPQFGALRDYPVFANALCAVFYFCAVMRGLFGKRELLPRVRGAVVMLLSMLVLMDFSLFPASRSTALPYLLLHFFTPTLAVLDWLLFGEKDHYRWISPLLWMIVPNLYFLYVILRAKFISGAGWLYDFLNIDAHGLVSVFLKVLFLNVFCIVLGYLFVSIDKLMAPHKKKRKKSK